MMVNGNTNTPVNLPHFGHMHSLAFCNEQIGIFPTKKPKSVYMRESHCEMFNNPVEKKEHLPGMKKSLH